MYQGITTVEFVSLIVGLQQKYKLKKNGGQQRFHGNKTHTLITPTGGKNSRF